VAVSSRTVQTEERLKGVERVQTLWRLFRNEKEDPEPFYRHIASETVDSLEARHGSLAGKRILDLGSGPGWFADELRNRGAIVAAIEYDRDEVGQPGTVAVGDAVALPFPDGAIDGILCSNMLEHAPDTRGVVEEIARVLGPGGWCYLSWTNWYSPHGGHEMTPYQYLGPNLGPKLYERLHGIPRKNRFGDGLYAVHVGPTMKLVRSTPGLTIDAVEPRYWPWARAVASVPLVREVVMWNCVIHMRRSESTA
jgi:SAM-dependent methyltransferase